MPTASLFCEFKFDGCLDVPFVSSNIQPTRTGTNFAAKSFAYLPSKLLGVIAGNCNAISTVIIAKAKSGPAGYFLRNVNTPDIKISIPLNIAIELSRY